MRKLERISKILEIFDKKYPSPLSALLFKNPWQLLVATILSAQCTDKQVNKVTPVLFEKYPDPKKLGEANLEEIEKTIKSIGLYRTKAKSIKTSSEYIHKNWNGELKQSIKELTELAGVGRKTANVVLYNAFGISEGIAVDTHVIRISNLLKLTKSKNAEKIEKDLMEIVQKKYWGNITHFFIEHGRETCIANRPKCEKCVVNKFCPSKKSK
jgi:endonuclease-3